MVPRAGLSFMEERHEMACEKRAMDFWQFSVKLSDGIWPPPGPTEGVYPAQDSQGCTAGLMPCPLSRRCLGTTDLVVAGEGMPLASVTEEAWLWPWALSSRSGRQKLPFVLANNTSLQTFAGLTHSCCPLTFVSSSQER